MTTTSPTPASDADIQTFAEMSAALTGFVRSVIKPFLDPVNLAGALYEFAVSQVGQAAMTSLLEAYRAIAAQPPQTIADTLLETSSPAPSAQAQLAQSILLMWYLGSWYVPGQPGNVVQVVSMQAYTNSLVWRVAQAHPMGYSPFTFGYWSQPPASLDTFGVNVGGGK